MAVALGYPHPDHLLACLTSAQLTELIAFYSIEGFGDTRADLRTGLAISQLANTLRGPRTPAYDIRDFMPRLFPKPQETSQQLSERIKTVLRAMNGKSR